MRAGIHRPGSPASCSSRRRRWTPRRKERAPLRGARRAGAPRPASTARRRARGSRRVPGRPRIRHRPSCAPGRRHTWPPATGRGPNRTRPHRSRARRRTTPCRRLPPTALPWPCRRSARPPSRRAPRAAGSRRCSRRRARRASVAPWMTGRPGRPAGPAGPSAAPSGPSPRCPAGAPAPGPGTRCPHTSQRLAGAAPRRCRVRCAEARRAGTPGTARGSGTTAAGGRAESRTGREPRSGAVAWPRLTTRGRPRTAGRRADRARRCAAGSAEWPSAARSGPRGTGNRPHTGRRRRRFRAWPWLSLAIKAASHRPTGQPSVCSAAAVATSGVTLTCACAKTCRAPAASRARSAIPNSSASPVARSRGR